MIRVDEIRIKRTEDSKIVMQDIQQILERCLKSVASATERAVVSDMEKVTAVLYRKISFQTMNKILNYLRSYEIKIMSVQWTRKEIGPVIRGHVEIIIS